MIIRMTKWTSELYVQTDISEDLRSAVLHGIDRISELAQNNFSKFHGGKYNGKVLDLIEWKEIEGIFDAFLKKCRRSLMEFITYPKDKTSDFTGLLKGLFLDELVTYIKGLGATKYLINFGGDITSKGYNIHVDAEYDDGPKLAIELSQEIKIFTSGNGRKRGKHIVKGGDSEFITVISYGDKLTCTDMDILATSWVGNSMALALTDAKLNEDYFLIHVDGNAKISTNGGVYVASPFFEKNEIEIRDKMVAHLGNHFRPDLTDDNKNYDAKGGETHTAEVAKNIMLNNVKHVESQGSLVFPEGTDDIGTLFEIGYAMKLKKPIFRYDPNNDSYTLVDSNAYTSFLLPNYDVIDCRTVTGAVILGYNYPDETLGYYLGPNVKDNLMISVNFHKMDLVNGEFIEVEKNYEEVR